MKNYYKRNIFSCIILDEVWKTVDKKYANLPAGRDNIIPGFSHYFCGTSLQSTPFYSSTTVLHYDTY